MLGLKMNRPTTDRNATSLPTFCRRAGVRSRMGRARPSLFALVGVLLDPGGASDDDLCAANVNSDATVDGLDVQPFIDLILTP